MACLKPSRLSLNNILKSIEKSPTIEDVVNLLRPYDIKDDFEINHRFGDNLYVILVEYPKGTLAVGRVHKYNHVFILAVGKVTIWTSEGKTTISAPCVMESKAGIQRVAFFHANSVCLNAHGHASEVDITADNVEEQLTTETYKDYEKFALEHFSSNKSLGVESGQLSLPFH